MITIATLGPRNSHAFEAARRYAPGARIVLHHRNADVLEAFVAGRAEYALLPIYNTREGENKEYFRLLDMLTRGWWIDNVVLTQRLSLGCLDRQARGVRALVARRNVFRQCEEYVAARYPEADLIAVHDVERAVEEIIRQGRADRAVIDSEAMLLARGLHLVEREVAPHNRTRYAVLGPEEAVPTGYDATVMITRPLDDRVGLLVDLLSEFSRRGINILDFRAENDIKTQKLQIYIEAEGHLRDQAMRRALEHIENRILQTPGAIRVLGSFPRVDMRVKRIKSLGFIGTGDMSAWFADRLENEGYRVMMTGRSTSLSPEEMITQVDVVVVCVPISVTEEVVRRFGPAMAPGKALILLAGEAEHNLAAALEATDPGVEVMLVHNLWGPKAVSMKDKNAIVVRTPRSGELCAEFEAFLYKHGADIYHDPPAKHDLLMGLGQKLPTLVSVALAATLRQHGITPEDIAGHCTLTSLYGILAMARVHSQNPRTYAEIMAMRGEGRRIVRDFTAHLEELSALAEQGGIPELRQRIEENSRAMDPDFLQARMDQARAVDEVLGPMIR